MKVIPIKKLITGVLTATLCFAMTATTLPELATGLTTYVGLTASALSANDFGTNNPNYMPSAAANRLQNYLTEVQFNELFPHRDADKATKTYYTYANLVEAMKQVADIKVKTQYRINPANGEVLNWAYRLTSYKKSTGAIYVVADTEDYNADFRQSWAIHEEVVDLGAFLAEGTENDKKREIAALLANFSQETGGADRNNKPECYKWGLYHIEEMGYSSSSVGGYVASDALNTLLYPPNPNKSYHGRGPIQTSYNYNYGRLAGVLFHDKSKWLNNPEEVANSGVYGFMTGLAFWMTPDSGKPSCHDVMISSKWESNPNLGMGMTIMIINGGLEGGLTTSDYRVGYRVGMYQYIAEKNGANISADKMDTTGMSGTSWYPVKSNNTTLDSSDLATAQVTLTPNVMDINGTTQLKPAVTVKDSAGKTLALNTDYSVTYGANNAAGAGKGIVEVNGQGKYKGKQTAYFDIVDPNAAVAKDLNNATLTFLDIPPSGYVADGTEKRPQIALYFNNVQVPASEYTLVYADNTNFGTATVTATAKTGSTGYVGTKVGSFKIAEPVVVTPPGGGSGNAWKVDVAYSKDDEVSYNGHLWKAKYWSQGEAPGSVDWGAWEDLGVDSTAPTLTSISTATLNGIAASYPKGSKPVPTSVVLGGVTLVLDKDYTLEWNEVGDKGHVFAIGKGAYTGSASVEYAVSGGTTKSISHADVTVNFNNTAAVAAGNVWEYTSVAITPAVTIKDGAKTLILGTDYTVAYSNNINVGTATVTITGKGAYSGTRTKNFNIVGTTKSISHADVTVNFNNTAAVAAGNVWEYTSVAITPAVTIKDGAKTLILGTDYTVAYSNNINVGTATVTITGKGAYSGTRTKNFNIVGTTKSISHADVTVNFNNTAAVAAGNVWEYTSVAITPAVTIKDGAKTLILGTDYTVAYSNNINVGTATVTITGKGAYSGTRTKNFNIVGTTKSISHADVTVNFNNTAAVAAGNVWEYTSVAITPAVTIKDGAKTLILGTDYTVAYSNNINVGTATVTITGKGAYSGTRTKNFNIVGTTKSISHADVTVNFNNTAAVAAGNVWEYTSVAITPAVTIKDGAKTLILGTDYTVAYSNNINVGTATVTITGKGAYSGTRTKNFNIVGTTKSISHADVTVNFNNTAAVAAGNVWEYTSVAITPAVTIKDGAKTLILGTDYIVAYSNNINVGTATVTITGKGAYSGTRTKNFNIVGTTKSISHADVTVNFNNIAAVAAGNVWEYTSVAITPAVTIKDGAKTLILGTDYTVAYSNNINVGTATVTITGKGAYSGTRTKNFNII